MVYQGVVVGKSRCSVHKVLISMYVIVDVRKLEPGEVREQEENIVG